MVTGAPFIIRDDEGARVDIPFCARGPRKPRPRREIDLYRQLDVRPPLSGHDGPANAPEDRTGDSPQHAKDRADEYRPGVKAQFRR